MVKVFNHYIGLANMIGSFTSGTTAWWPKIDLRKYPYPSPITHLPINLLPSIEGIRREDTGTEGQETGDINHSHTLSVPCTWIEPLLLLPILLLLLCNLLQLQYRIL